MQKMLTADETMLWNTVAKDESLQRCQIAKMKHCQFVFKTLSTLYLNEIYVENS